MNATIKLTVNGKRQAVTTDPDRPLLDVLREDLGLTGTKYGCGEGQCGACAVLLNGEKTRSCVTPVSSADGQKIVTIEGLATGGKLHPVQEAFLAEKAMQCGYCTPGQIVTIVALLMKKPNPTDAEIAEALEENLCRCCGYMRIAAATHRAAKQNASAAASIAEEVGVS